MATTRAKFRCNSVQSFGVSSPATIEFTAVNDDSTPENERFTKYTHSGKLTVSVDNPAVVFVPGASYYLDFTKAE